MLSVAKPGFQFMRGKIKREKIESKIILKNSNSILITNKKKQLYANIIVICHTQSNTNVNFNLFFLYLV